MIRFNDIAKLAGRGNVIPVFGRISGDLDTPVSIFMRLAARKRHAFLLESFPGRRNTTRYSYVGFDPFLVVESNPTGTVLSQGAVRKNLTAPALEVTR